VRLVESSPNNITIAMGAWILLPSLTKYCFLPRSCSVDHASVENVFMEKQEHTSHTSLTDPVSLIGMNG
jgi:hypothetical protein